MEETVGENANFEISKEKMEYFEKLLKESKENLSKQKIAVGLIKKELEKQPLSKQLHELYLSFIKNDRNAINKFINDLISVFAITLDYKYYDLILMLFANEIYLSSKDVSKKEIYNIINELHTLIKNYYSKKQAEFQKHIEILEEANKELDIEIRESVKDSSISLLEVEQLKLENIQLEQEIREVKSRKEVLEDGLKEEKATIDVLEKEKEIMHTKNSELQDKINNISDVMANVIVRQDSDFDKIDSSLKQLDRIHDSISPELLDLVPELDKGGLSGKSDESIGLKLQKYINVLEILLNKTNEEINHLKNKNDTLAEQLLEYRQDLTTEKSEKEKTKAKREQVSEFTNRMENVINQLEKMPEAENEYAMDKNDLIRLLRERERFKDEAESKESLIKSYKEAIYEIFDENHDLMQEQEEIKQLLNSYENGIITFLKRRIFNKK